MVRHRLQQLAFLPSSGSSGPHLGGGVSSLLGWLSYYHNLFNTCQSSNLDSCWGNSLWPRLGVSGQLVVSGDDINANVTGVTKTLLATLIYN